jgi:hypothetical protein
MLKPQKETEMPSLCRMKLLDPVTKMDLVMLLYRAMENRKPGYGVMHKAAKALQDFIETKYGYTLGYGFSDPSIFEIWDNQFQEDIERDDVLGRVLDNSDVLVSETKGYYTHELKLRRPDGEFLLKDVSKRNLEKKFGTKLDALLEEMKKHV